ncbi:Protein ARRD-26 [Aphelenchoides avenae]|nr:Protein ARRD-26 [Aphelenchus avenae]
MKIENFELALNRDCSVRSDEADAPRNYYLGGEELKGTIDLLVKERVRIARLSVRAFGSAHTAWRNKLSDIAFESREVVLDEYKDLTSELSLHCNELLEIHEGQHKIEFSIKLPLDVVSSIEKENHGSIRYTCIAVLDVPDGGESEIIAEKEFRVYSLLNLDAPHFRQPVQAEESVNIIGCCCRRPKGYISADMTVAELGLLPGETTKVTLVVENTVKKRSQAKKHLKAHSCGLVCLCQQLQFRGQNRYDRTSYEEKTLTIVVESQGACKVNPRKGPETKVLDFTIPKGLPPTSTKETGLVTCTYYFRLDMEHFDVIVPVVIGSTKTLDPG